MYGIAWWLYFMSDLICFEFNFNSWSAYYGFTCGTDLARVQLLGRIHDYTNHGMILVEYVVLIITLQIQVLFTCFLKSFFRRGAKF